MSSTCPSANRARPSASTSAVLRYGEARNEVVGLTVIGLRDRLLRHLRDAR